MGVDINFFVRPQVGPEEIQLALRTIGIPVVEFKSTHTPEFTVILLKYEDSDKNRAVNFFFNVHDSYFGMPCNMLSMRLNDQSEEIMERLAKMFGGILQRSDTTNDCEMFQVPGSGNLRWLLERYYAMNENTPDAEGHEDLEHFTEYVKKDKFGY